jgi:hypothetical protein
MLYRTLLENNSALDSPTNSSGGAILNEGGTVKIVASSLFANYAEAGAAIANTFNGEVLIANSTIAGNGSLGYGAIANFGDANTRLLYSTISDNVVLEGNTDTTANIYIYHESGFAPTVQVSNSIIAFPIGFGTVSCNRLVINEEKSVQWPDTTCGNLSNYDPGLGLPGLYDNDPLPILPLFRGSAAIDIGNTTACVTEPIYNVDQALYLRSLDGDANNSDLCDIGAYETASVQDTIGIYRPSTNYFYLRLSNTTGQADIYVTLSGLGMNPNLPYFDMPVVGDWNGDGIDTVGFYRTTPISHHKPITISCWAIRAIRQLSVTGTVVAVTA